MADLGDNADSHERIRFVNATGSPVTLGHRDGVERIREAMVDLQVAIDGCVAQSPDRLGDTVASLARHCSIFLRKMVLGDKRSPRLLDGDFCQMAELGFNKISKVPTNRRTLTLVPIDIARGYIQATKLDEGTSDPEYTEVIPIGPQRLTIDIEWPLPGMTHWLDQPVPEAPWEIRVEGLFESQSDQVLDCEPLARTATSHVRQTGDYSEGCRKSNGQHRSGPLPTFGPTHAPRGRRGQSQVQGR